MAFFPSYFILTTLSLFHLTIAFYLVTAPSTVTTHTLVMVLGGSMRIPPAFPPFAPELMHPAGGSQAPNPFTAIAGLLLAFIAVSDLTAVNMRDEIYLLYWTAQIPVRISMLFGLEAWIYLTRPSEDMIGRSGQSLAGLGWSAVLKNDVIFTWAFVDLALLFWSFLALRDERREAAVKLAEKRNREATEGF